ncbi:MAG: KamA family protein [Bacteroidales bacterium]|nr:KamA family protein [Bacteroidales bacterium]
MYRVEPNSALNTYSRQILNKILIENIEIGQIFIDCDKEQFLLNELEKVAQNILAKNPIAVKYYKNTLKGREVYNKLRWKDFAAIRILDYIKHAGEGYEDMNLGGKVAINNPLRTLWLAIKTGNGQGTPDFFDDMLHLFRQLSGKHLRTKPSSDKTTEWISRFSTGLDNEIVAMRERNRNRIIQIIVHKIDEGQIKSKKFKFKEEHSLKEKIELVNDWWKDHTFHLKMAIRSADELNEFLSNTLNAKTLATLKSAEKTGIPFFINPYYLSLINTEHPDYKQNSDQTIRDYIFVNEELIEEFGQIIAWEKEDVVRPNLPNAAGWILPEGNSLHRRYPEAAIFIPKTMGRSCGGLCVSCQRMYDFQSGNFNFNLKKLEPHISWTNYLQMVMDYFRNDSQLRDILITGGDAFMSSDTSIKIILDHVYDMALDKIKDNKNRPEGEKYAEMVRVRLGTRLPVYLPQRFTPTLIKILKEFKQKASKIGLKQFIIQTHFVSALEITPDTKQAIQKLISSGWMVTNQVVFTTAASRRGHTSTLRKVLNDIGILTYYTFQVKGHRENKFNFTPIARSVQEQVEEKSMGNIPNAMFPEIQRLLFNEENMVKEIIKVRKQHGLPFLATDRNVLNMPGVGKSLTFRVIGLTDDGRRILEFEHDLNRNHSPIIEKMGKVVVIESKSITQYLRQLKDMGESIKEYQSIYGYSMGETEDRMPLYEYSEYNYKVTSKITNLSID